MSGNPVESDGVVLTPNPYDGSLHKKRLSSTGSYVQDSPGYSRNSSSLPGNGSGYVNNARNSNPSIHGSATSKLSIYNSTQDISPENGSLMLGRHGFSGNKYTTRFRINTAVERATAGTGVFLEECCLCTNEENRSSPWQCFKSVIMSEAFLLTFHLGALSLGVVKSSIRREDIDEDIELIHSIVELFAVAFVLFSRVMLVRESLESIKKTKRANQHQNIGNDKFIIGSSTKRLVLAFTILCVIFDLLTILGFIIFYYFVHLGWTTLLNNAILIIATVLSNIILKKLQLVRLTIVADEHKVALYEATMLMKEGQRNMTDGERDSYNKTVMTFIKALLDTDTFQKPDHIELKNKYGPRWDTVTTMEVFSTV